MTRLGLTQIARELGLGRRNAEKELRRLQMIYPPKGRPRTWDARVVDLILAMHGKPHRTLQPVAQDWLSAYLETTHGISPTRPRSSWPS